MRKFFVSLLLSFFICGSVTSVFSVASAPDLVEDTWHTIASMNYSRSMVNVIVVDDKIYAMGGYTFPQQLETLSINEQYDPEMDTWITLASVPVPERA